jgi:hypothetical protein
MAMIQTTADAEQTREDSIAAVIKVLLERGIAVRRTKLPDEELGARLWGRVAADPGLDSLQELECAIPEGARASRERIHSRPGLWTGTRIIITMPRRI